MESATRLFLTASAHLIFGLVLGAYYRTRKYLQPASRTPQPLGSRF